MRISDDTPVFLEIHENTCRRAAVMTYKAAFSYLNFTMKRSSHICCAIIPIDQALKTEAEQLVKEK